MHFLFSKNHFDIFFNFYFLDFNSFSLIKFSADPDQVVPILTDPILNLYIVLTIPWQFLTPKLLHKAILKQIYKIFIRE